MHSILIVDDEPITQMDLSEMLTEQGFAVVGCASDGFDAVELCRQLSPDVVLMDVRMPVFDGLGAAETIIQEDLARCVVLITAFCDRELIDRANQIGVTGYLVKPIEERLLLPTIEVAMAQSRRMRALVAQVQASQQQVEESKIIEQAKSVLARQKGISESEAYQQLRQLSMNKRCSIAILAKVVLDNHSQREVVARAKAQLMRVHGLSENEAFQRLKQAAEQQGISQLAAARQLLGEAKTPPGGKS